MPEKSWMAVADDLIHNHRNKIYAHPLPNFLRIAMFWSIDAEVILTPVQVARMMMTFKIARDIHGFTPDNYIDSIGYAGCVQRMDQLMRALGYLDGAKVLYNVDMNAMFYLLRESLDFLRANPDFVGGEDTPDEIAEEVPEANVDPVAFMKWYTEVYVQQ